MLESYAVGSKAYILQDRIATALLVVILIGLVWLLFGRRDA